MNSLRIAFATYAGAPRLTPDDRLAAAALASRGIGVVPAIWSSPDVDWMAFDAVILRSMWDYHHRVSEFRGWLDRLDELGVACWNPVSLARWNLDKRYLRDLQTRGVPTIPTVWLGPGELRDLASIMDRHGWPEVVLKPVIGATAHRTVRMSRAEAEDAGERLTDLAEHGPVMLQPFLADVAARGEWSLVFIDGEFSHAVLKRAAAGDFRVQEEFGGHTIAAEAPRDLRAAAKRILDLVGEPCLYARVDGVTTTSGDFLLMELELLEPLLFFAHHPHAAEKLAEAVMRRLSA